MAGATADTDKLVVSSGNRRLGAAFFMACTPCSLSLPGAAGDPLVRAQDQRLRVAAFLGGTDRKFSGWCRMEGSL